MFEVAESFDEIPQPLFLVGVVGDRVSRKIRYSRHDRNRVGNVTVSGVKKQRNGRVSLDELDV